MQFHPWQSVAIAPLLLCLCGCDGNVETTDDATRIEAEIPKLEIGDQPLDLQPSTDGDVDIDTPLPGDS
ncbi:MULTISPECIES: hypothetical protein [Rosistilla]|uniref:Uncharacterized protein n=2 Tax=Rosistilla TaxID=2795779 RepID=A0A518IZD2_9BACT|nr:MULTISPECIES: hypothetical protein [Rosistilla]QDS89147.1 hypothetical protein EC9_33440 [Rosistilla ulvae]QDV58452.1 hypothetical protein Mal33_44750 [Rosistilla oblonga]